jgi:hypothetical protein
VLCQYVSILAGFVKPLVGHRTDCKQVSGHLATHAQASVHSPHSEGTKAGLPPSPCKRARLHFIHTVEPIQKLANGGFVGCDTKVWKEHTVLILTTHDGGRRFSETLVTTYQTTRYHNLDDGKI